MIVVLSPSPSNCSDDCWFRSCRSREILEPAQTDFIAELKRVCEMSLEQKDFLESVVVELEKVDGT